MITPTYRVILGRIDVAQGPWNFRDKRNIFLPNIGENQKNVFPSEPGAQALCHMVNPFLVIALRYKKVR